MMQHGIAGLAGEALFAQPARLVTLARIKGRRGAANDFLGGRMWVHVGLPRAFLEIIGIAGFCMIVAHFHRLKAIARRTSMLTLRFKVRRNPVDCRYFVFALQVAHALPRPGRDTCRESGGAARSVSGL